MYLSTANLIIALCSLMIESTLIRYSRKKKILPLRNNQLFLNMLKAGFVATAMNLITLLLGVLSPSACVLKIHYFSDILYFVFYEISFFYIAAYVLWNAKKLSCFLSRHLVRLSLFLIIPLTVLMTQFWNDIFYITPDNRFHYGAQSHIPTVFPFLLVLWTLIVLIKNRFRILNERDKGLLSGTVILLLGIVADNMTTELVLIDFFFCFSALIFYICHEHPALCLSERTNCYNLSSFETLVNELIASDKDFYVYGFEVRNYNTVQSCRGTATLFSALSSCGTWVEACFPDAYVFYMGYRVFNILSLQPIDPKDYEAFAREGQNKAFKSTDGGVYFWTRRIRVDTASPLCENASYIINGEIQAMDSASLKADVISVDSQTYAAVTNEMRLHTLIEKSLSENRLQIFIQPICNAKTGKTEGGEVLARILDDAGRIVMPGDFIPLAEKSGMIIKIGYRLFEKTCRFVSENALADLGITFLTINCSPVQFQDLFLADKLKAISDAHHVDFSFFKFEVTESTMNNNALMKIHIDKFRNHGASIAMDDFGKGNSNLSRLTDFKFDVAKLDMSLVWSYFKSEDTMLVDILSLLKKKDMTIVAEGVETQEMAKALAELHCDYLQGYYFSKPLPAEDFLKTLSSL